MKLGVLALAVLAATDVALARSSRPSSGHAARRGSAGGRGGPSRKKSRRSSPSRPSAPVEYDDEDDEDSGDFGLDEYSEEEESEEEFAPRERRPSGRSGGRAPGGGRRQPPRRPAYDDEDDYDDYDEDEYAPPPRRSSSRGGSRGGGGRRPPPRGHERRVTTYGGPRRRGPPQPSAFTRGLSAIRDSMPDPNTVKDTMLSATKAAQEKTSALSSNLYREVKGLTSSELEQVMLKSTRPDETPVKTKHVERLVGVTYQISGKYDIYDAVLRKLWNKMAERDIRTKLKSVYVLHRFSVDGGPEHQEALKQRLRALRKTKDPKRSGGGGRGGSTRYFDSKVLIGPDNDPDNSGYRAFLSRYAHYVLTRAQTFGGVFNEISLAQSVQSSPSRKSSRKSSSKASAAKPKSPPLSEEHLKFARMVLKAGLACNLHDGEECESTAMCLERVAADLMGLTSTVATALKRELKGGEGDACDPELVRSWCEFYSDELLPDTKRFVKRITNKLDVYGLYLPSRMSASLPPELLEKGLKMGMSDGGESSAAPREENGAEDDNTPEEDETCAEETDAADTSVAMSAEPDEPDDDDELYDEEYYDEEYDEE